MEDPRLARLKAAIVAKAWRWRPGKPIPYGEQLIVDDGEHEATLDFYPKRGRSVVGGAQTALRRELAALADRITTPAAPAKPAAAPVAAPPFVAHIGMDESGKGDWFGPLVVAAVYLEPKQAEALGQAGVRDSKELSAVGVAELAATIGGVVAPEARIVSVLAPLEYNRRYAELGNINLLLADLYAASAAALTAATGATQVICDQFAQRADRLDRAFAAAGLPKPTQMHHAESASLAVAAASILAAARFGQELARLGAQAGLAGPLPRGASAIRELRGAARTIIAREGAAALGNYAKLNFKPVQELLQG